MIGCGGLYLQASGEPAIGETATFALPTASGLRGFVAGVPVQWPVAACPGCMQGANGTTLLANTLQIAIPPVPAFVGLTIAVQGFEFLPAGQPCLGQVVISNTIDMTIQ